MTASIGYWEDLTTTDLASVDAERAVAILPVAAVEQHGPHLPLGTDAMINREVVARALALVPPDGWVRALPTQAVGESLEHTAFAGTLTLPAETVIGLWTAIGEAVARAGVRKLILCNSHGGQTGLVDAVAVRLRQQADMAVVRASTFGLGLPTGIVGEAEATYGLHGGQVETAVMLALRPDLVRRDRIASFRSAAETIDGRHRVLRAEGAVGLGWAAQDLNPAGVTGDAAAATAEAGQAILDHWGRALADLIVDLTRFPLASLVDRPA